MRPKQLRELVEPEHPELSIVRQCDLLGLPRSSYYYAPSLAYEEDLLLKRLLDEQYTRTPFYGSRRMTAWLAQQGHAVNRKRVVRLLAEMGLQAVYPRRGQSQPAPGHRIYPYLLRGVKVERVGQVFSTDLTYIRMRRGFVYLVAVMDWYSRYVLSWGVSTTMDQEFCVEALDKALAQAVPEIFNTDQGAQFTSEAFVGKLLEHGVRVSMDGRGRALDNVFIERLWRSVKYEEVYLKEYETVRDAVQGLGAYFRFYNCERLHQALGYRTPESIYFSH
jgi:putative transposase